MGVKVGVLPVSAFIAIIMAVILIGVALYARRRDICKAAAR